MYLPLMALVALVVIGAVLLWERLTPPVVERPGVRSSRVVIATLAVALASAPLVACTVTRNREYGSALTLAGTSVARWPSPGGHYLLAVELSTAGRYEEAMQQFREAAPEVAPARYGLGLELFRA